MQLYALNGLTAHRVAWAPAGLDEVVVAVIGSGVELSHSGLGPSVWANAGEVAGDNLDNDGNGEKWLLCCSLSGATPSPQKQLFCLSC
jgi:hypothetical protein